MLNEYEIKQVWEGMLSAEIRANYFADLSRRYHWRQRAITWAILFTSSGACVALIKEISQIWPWVAPVLALATVGLSFYGVVSQNQRSATDTADLHFRWNKLASDYKRLWSDTSAATAHVTLKELVEKAGDISKTATSFPAKQRLLTKWQNHVEAHHGVKEPVATS